MNTVESGVEYHPRDEAELIAIVRHACCERLKLRVRGSAHSVAHAIYTDPLRGIKKAVNHTEPPDGPNINVVLDLYTGYRVTSEEERLIEVDAGMTLGDVYEHGECLRKGLLHELYDRRGWMLSGTGGIAHQTVAGFTATGSAGGSLGSSMNDNVCGFRLIDGLGKPHDICEDHADFPAMIPNLGLLGVVSKVRFRCVEAFDIEGRQVTTVPSERLGALEWGAGALTSLRTFLTDTPYARVEWWPQRGAARVRAWEAHAITPDPAVEPVPFRQFERPLLDQVLAAVVLTVLGNIDELDRVGDELDEVLDHFGEQLMGELEDALMELGALGRWLARLVGRAPSRTFLLAREEEAEPDPSWIRRQIPKCFPALLKQFVPLDAESKAGRPQEFRDYSWRSLPMDHEADDVYLPVEFTELWVPMRKLEDAMQVLNAYFCEPESSDTAYARTGTFAFELYAAKVSGFWLNPAYSEPGDDWADGAHRRLLVRTQRRGSPRRVLPEVLEPPARGEGAPSAALGQVPAAARAGPGLA